MTSCDTDILVYAYNEDAPEHGSCATFLADNLRNPDFGVSEHVLVEFYNLVRNPKVFPAPLSPRKAVDLVEELRGNRYWRTLKGLVDVSDPVWAVAATRDLPRRAVLDARLAYALAAEGVTRFATRNVADFRRFGVFEAFDPLVEAG